MTAVHWDFVERPELTSVPPTCSVWIDGVRMADGQPDELDDEPVVLTDLHVVWGRGNSLDQPAPSTSTFKILDLAGGQRFLDAVSIGAHVGIRTDGTVYGDPSVPTFPALPLANATVQNGTLDRATGIVAPIDGTKPVVVWIPPDAYSSDPSAWNDVPRSQASQYWRASVGVTLQGDLGTALQRVELAPVSYVNPSGTGARILAPIASTTTVGKTTLTASFQPPNDVWVGLALTLYPTGPAWLDVPPAVVWNSLGGAAPTVAAAAAISAGDASGIRTAYTIATPVGAAAGQWCYLAQTWFTSGGMANAPGTPPGWTKVNEQSSASFGGYLTVYRRKWVAGDSISVGSSTLGTTSRSVRASAVWVAGAGDALPAIVAATPDGTTKQRFPAVAAGSLNIAAASAKLSASAPPTPTLVNGTLRTQSPSQAQQASTNFQTLIATAGDPTQDLVVTQPTTITAPLGFSLAVSAHAVAWNELSRFAIAPAEVSLLAPAAGTVYSALVFSGRITDLTARYDLDKGGTVVEVIAADHTAELANRYVGDQPWVAEPLGSRFSRIMALSGSRQTFTVDPVPAALPVTWRDVDAQPSAKLLQELAISAGGVLWSATNLVTGPYLRLEDINARPPTSTLVELGDGTVTIIPAAAGSWGALTVSACSFLLEPVEWLQASDDNSTRVAVSWWSQEVDDDGNPKVTGRTETAIDPAEEDRSGRRRIGIGTQLATPESAANLAAMVLARVRTPSWRVGGLVWDMGADEPLTPPQLLEVLRLLDSTTRIGLPLLLVDLPSWAPVSANESIPLYLEGGRYVNIDGYWRIELLVSDARAQGKAGVAWNQLNAGWLWNEFDPEIAWSDLAGVGI